MSSRAFQPSPAGIPLNTARLRATLRGTHLLWSTVMEPRLIAAIILAPFALAFLYSAIHELFRYRSEGRAEYGLSYSSAHIPPVPRSGSETAREWPNRERPGQRGPG